MDNKYHSILTRVGIEKLTRAQMNGTQVKLIDMAVGDMDRELDEEMTELGNEVWRGPINDMGVDPLNPSWIYTETHIPEDVGGFWVREAGVYDEDGDLIVISRQPASYKPLLDNGTAKQLIIRIITEVSNADTVELSIDPSIVMASREYVDSKYVETVKNLEERMDAFQSEMQQKIDGLSSMTDMLAKGLQRVMINLELDGKTQGGYGFFDDFEGTPKAMWPLTQQLILERELPAGTTEIEQDGTVFKVGEELTIFDKDNSEDVVVKEVSKNKLVVNKLDNPYLKGAILTGKTAGTSFKQYEMKGELL